MRCSKNRGPLPSQMVSASSSGVCKFRRTAPPSRGRSTARMRFRRGPPEPDSKGGCKGYAGAIHGGGGVQRNDERQCGRGAPADLSARRGGFPSDLRDPEWARLAPLIPPASPGRRSRKTDMRAEMNAILYLRRTGCPWRYLPRDRFPPSARSTTSSASSTARGSMGGDLG